MRFVLGALLLLALFALAKRWQEHWTTELRAERERTFVRQELPSDDRAPVLGRVVVGRQSGADAFEGTNAQIQIPGGGAARGMASSPDRVPAPPPPQQSAVREFQLVVQRGQRLSDICRKHYGTSRGELVDALARYNQMADADHLREGQRLLLPPLESLLGQQH